MLLSHLFLGGSHWSLLVFDKISQTFIHFDSMNDSNGDEALKFYKKYKAYFGAKNMETSKRYPQQINSSDCGLYVLGKF